VVIWRLALALRANFLFERPEAFWIAPKKMLWGKRRDSCKIVASINLQLTEPPNAETPRQQ
jgi:hypothetical protein